MNSYRFSGSEEIDFIERHQILILNGRTWLPLDKQEFYERFKISQFNQFYSNEKSISNDCRIFCFIKQYYILPVNRVLVILGRGA